MLTYTFILEISITETRIVNNSFNTSTIKTFSYYHRLSGWGYTDFYRNMGKKLAIELEPPKQIGKGDLKVESRVVKRLRMLNFCALERVR